MNEQIEVGAEKFSRDRAEFGCDGGRGACSALITLTLGEYEAVRVHPDWFAIVRGHETGAAERVVEEYEGYAVVERSGRRFRPQTVDTPAENRAQATKLRRGR